MRGVATNYDTSHTSRTIVVGVSDHQPHVVLRCAAEFARRFDAELVCATADMTKYTFDEHPNGSVDAFAIDPDLPDADEDAFDAALAKRIDRVLSETGVPWSTRELAGDPASALGHLADTVDAVCIVVGTRRPGLRGSIEEFFTGSVAVHLAHRQHRPVVVVPLTPVGTSGSLPWDDDTEE